MAPRRNASTVELRGPLFEKDPGKTVLENARDMLAELARYGEQKVRADIAARAGRMARYTGWTYEHVKGRVDSNDGKRWYRHAVVSANTDGMVKAEAIRTKAAASTIERRWHPFRRAAFASRAAIKKADLAKGLE